MKKVLIKRLFFNICSLWIIISLTFIMMKTIPGDPFLEEKKLPKQILLSMKSYYHLNDPLFLQYGKYLISLIKWDLGNSLIYSGRSVNKIIKETFPVSAILGIEALSTACFFGLLFGFIKEFFANKLQKSIISFVFTLLLSLPNFVIAAILQYIGAIKLSLFPIASWGSFIHSILPSLSLAIIPTAFIARLTSETLKMIKNKNYILFAYSKGLSEIKIIFKHLLPSVLTPVFSYIGPLSANIITGTFIIESLFGIPGLGKHLVGSIGNRDYPVIIGVTVFYGIILIFFTLLTDFLQLLMNPEIKLSMYNEN